MAADGIICEGDHLVLDVNGEKLSFVQKLKANGTIRVGKHTVSSAPLVGAPYGALFEVTTDGKCLQRVLLPPADEITRITDTERDNSGLFDRGENQKLTQEEIEELKKSGKAGSEIIEALCSNSATFEKKTEFAQDKYKRRKAKKYLTYLTVRKPTARIVCEAHYDKCPERVWNLRHDSLAVMLSLANVAAGAKVLVVEHCMGVVTAAAVERLGGLGTVCAAQVDERQAPVDAVRQMNLDTAQRSVLFTAYASSLLRDKDAADRGELYPAAVAAAAGDGAGGSVAAAAVADATASPAAAQQEASELGAGAAEADAKAEADPKGEAMEVDKAEVATPAEGGEAADVKEAADGGNGGGAGQSTAPAEQGGQQQQRGGGGGSSSGYGSFLPRPEALRSVLTTGFDSCLLAHPKLHPTALLAALWPLLAPSATFAVYSPWPQPLAEALSHLQGSRNAVMLQLQESWLRPYQVLPARTHPTMSCSGSGGYLLSGIKVAAPDATPLAAQLQQHLAAASGAAAGGGGGGGRGRGEGEARGEAREQQAGGEEAGGGGGRQEAAGNWGGRGGRGRDNGFRGGGGRGRGGGRWGGDGGGGGRWSGDGGGRGRGRGGRDGGDSGGGRGKRKGEGEGRSGDSPAGKRQAQ